MNHWDIHKIIPLLKECGSIAMSYYANPHIEIKADLSIVTAADKAIEARLAVEFDHHNDGVHLIGEETIASRSEEYIHRALTQTCWVVDPIDGTAPYSAGFPAWGISIGFMEKGILKEGAIYLPPQDELIITDGEQVWRCHGLTGGGELEPMQFSTQPFTTAGIISISQKTAKYGRINLPNQVFAWSGCVASFYYLFTGKLMAYITSLKLWDIAGAIPIMERSGLIGRTLDGKYINNKVVNGCFDLEASSKCRWALRGHAVIGDSEETINHIINHISLPEN